jgi:hypothetical protein
LGRAKDIVVKPISSNDANRIIRSLHYSGKVVNNSAVHFGIFLGGKCGGALQFGCPLDKAKVVGLVAGTKWNNMLELNRMALADWLPKNGESRVISICLRLIRKHYPHVDWVLSYADGTMCGHGTIYQAAGFALTMVKKNLNIARLPNGQTIHKMTLASNPHAPRPELDGKSFFDVTGGTYSFSKYVNAAGAEVLAGNQLRYIYFLNPECRSRLTVPELPYTDARQPGVAMYKGQRVTSDTSDTAANPGGKGRCNSDRNALVAAGDQ